METKHKKALTNWAENSKGYETTLKEWQLIKDKRSKSSLKKSIDVEVDGFLEFKSANMYVNCNQIEGYLMKKINNLKVYHSKPFHKKYFKIVYITG